MSDSHDYQFARILQQQFDHEASSEIPNSNLTYTNKSSSPPKTGKSLIDPSWELIDPTPNIFQLFVTFNDTFFWNKLVTVCVDWSKRMTSCAGICSYQGRGGMCKITLSEPLLKLRPRKDLVETLLHEMIHAYLFVTRNNKDRDGHGPEFQKHMHRINNEAGTKITIYHSFHDEVKLYKTHWWKCNGPCQNRKPFYGMVKRSMNRAPGPNDCWFQQHLETCGGTFIKVKEPEKKTKEPKAKEKINNYPKIDSFFDSTKNTPAKKPENNVVGLNGPVNINKTSVNARTFINNANADNIGDFKNLNKNYTKGALKNSTNTIVINKKPATATITSADVDNTVEAFAGKGYSLQTRNKQENRENDYSLVRNHWLNRFSSPTESSPPQKRPLSEQNPSKKCKISQSVTETTSRKEETFVKCPVCQKEFSESNINSHLDECITECSKIEAKKDSFKSEFSECPVCCVNVEQDIFDRHVQKCLEKIYDESEENVTSVLETVVCFICNKNVDKAGFDSHMEECMSL